VQARAVYISIPCCVGKIAHHESDSGRAERSCGDLTYPRSQEYVSLGCSLPEYLHVAKAADFGHHGYDVAQAGDCSGNCVCTGDSGGVGKQQGSGGGGGRSRSRGSSDAHTSSGKVEALTKARRLAKRVIEQDRNLYARGEGYVIHMALCHPTSCTPKNDILIGIPDERQDSIATFNDWTRTKN
jgi:hypothetical protein